MNDRRPGAPGRAAAFLRERPGAAVLLLFAAVILLLNPLRDIPMDDDWLYRRSVDGLLAHGRLIVHDLASPSVVFHAFWGWLFSLPAGASYSALRLSTLALAAVPLWLTAESSPRRSWLNPGLWLLFSPVFLLLSFTYMTDVPYLCWATLSVWLYARGIEKDSGPLLLAASAAAGAALLVRQVGLAIPLAAAAFMLLGPKRLRPARLLTLLPALLAAAGYYAWFYGAHGPNWAHYYYSLKIVPRLLDFGPYLLETLRRLAASALYLGLFTAPYALRLAAAEGFGLLRNRRALACLGALLVFFILEGALPYFTGGGVISGGGVGRAYLGSYLPGDFKPAGLLGGPVFMGLLTALGAFSLAAWCAKAGELRAALRADRFLALLAAASALQALGMLLFFDAFFDRYLLPALPAALLAAAAVPVKAPGERTLRALAAALLCALAFWGVAGTWDHLNFSSAKWEAGRAAVAAGFAPEDIANGYEWDAAWSYEKNTAELKRRGVKDTGPWDWRELSVTKARSSFRQPEAAAMAVSSAAYFSPLSLRLETIYINRE